MAGADIGRTKQRPLRIEPEAGQVLEDLREAEPEVPSNVLKHDESGPKMANGVSNSGPKVAGVIFSLSLSCG